jgi:hypothetical protein
VTISLAGLSAGVASAAICLVQLAGVAVDASPTRP